MAGQEGQIVARQKGGAPRHQIVEIGDDMQIGQVAAELAQQDLAAHGIEIDRVILAVADLGDQPRRLGWAAIEQALQRQGPAGQNAAQPEPGGARHLTAADRAKLKNVEEMMALERTDDMRLDRGAPTELGKIARGDEGDLEVGKRRGVHGLVPTKGGMN